MELTIQSRPAPGAVASASFASARMRADARVAERRGEAMRRLFPLRHAASATRREAEVAALVYGYLAEAATLAALEQRLQAVGRYPTGLIRELRLRDGRAVLVRPVLPQDAAMQRAFVQGLSALARQRRFHATVAEFPQAVIRYLTEVDYVDHLALVGEAVDAAPRHVAEARWVRRAEERDCADFAISVADDHQRAGLGTRLLDMLEVSAAAQGVRRLVGSVLAGNAPMIAWLRGRGWRLTLDEDDDSVLCAERTLAVAQWRKAA
jgi:acetyltransferase